MLSLKPFPTTSAADGGERDRRTTARAVRARPPGEPDPASGTTTELPTPAADLAPPARLSAGGGLKGEIRTLAKDLRFHKAIKLSSGALAPAGFGDAQTILLVGNDQRNHTTTTPVLPHSNEMLLVRIDPSKPWVSMMSIPRELMVPIQTPGGPVTTRLNAALEYGGISLLVSTIKQVTGLSINHVVVIDFNQFKTAVDDIGCVYSTVDRRYYHVNTPYSQQYQEINLQPGDQKLCGTQALQFVSYRHGDTSLVRDARDQDFLLDVKKEYGATLLDNIHEFERIFGISLESRLRAGLPRQPLRTTPATPHSQQPAPTPETPMHGYA